MKLALCSQMRSIDKAATEEYNIPNIILMENAAVSVFEICKRLEVYRQKKVLIFCGIGNNGGDGFALARHMRNDGADVSAVLVGEPEKIKGDAKTNYDICVNMQISIIKWSAENAGSIKNMISGCQLIIDAMLGTGTAGELKTPFKDAVSAINESGKFIVAIDCPTGGNPDNGQVTGECVKADLTVTLALLKPGLLLYPLADYAGKVEIGQIGAPKALFDSIETGFCALDAQSAARLLPKRRGRSHKGTYGKAAIVAGSAGMAGAAAYCAKAAYKAGCGYVNICAPDGIIPVIQQLAPQAVVTPLSERDGMVFQDSADKALETINKSTVCLIGPGLGLTKQTACFVKQIIKNAKVPLIIDADALNAVSDEPEILKTTAAPPVITPHPLEMSRLTGLDIDYILDNMPETAKDFSSQYNTVTVLKDATTIIACKDGNTYINKGECNAIAKAGSGDILAGIIAGLMAQGLGGASGGALGAYIHSRSGMAAADKYSDYSVCSDDIIDHVHEAIMKLKEAEEYGK